MSDETETLYDRIGGAATVSRLVDKFYSRILNDPQLRPFFADTSIERLTSMQKEFFAAALDGPVRRTDLDLAYIHQGRGIRRRHFSLFVNHLIAVLEDEEIIDNRDAMDIVDRISTYVDEIIGEAGGSGD
ncbi:MAG: group 1 truncated hemoglobin [Planctomycetaceae bacterium]